MRGFGVENRSYGGHRRWCLDERHSVNQRTARIGGGQAEGGPHRRGLPGAVRPKETGHLVVFGGETGIIKHGLTPEAFGKASIVIMIRAYTPASPVLRNPAVHGHCGCGAGVMDRTEPNCEMYTTSSASSRALFDNPGLPRQTASDTVPENGRFPSVRHRE